MQSTYWVFDEHQVGASLPDYEKELMDKGFTPQEARLMAMGADLYLLSNAAKNNNMVFYPSSYSVKTFDKYDDNRLKP